MSNFALNRNEFFFVVLIVKKKYDYIIAGGGCAGLSLAWHMMHRKELKDKEILIIDRVTKSENDRTWCFWEKENGPFEAIVEHRWEQAWFHTNGFSKLLDLKPYWYKMIRADRFYIYIKTHLATFPNIHWLEAEVLNCDSGDYSAFVETGNGEFEGDWVFTSIVPKVLPKPGYHYLLQHFTGWMVKTKEPAFDPAQPTLMDFRVDQKEDCRFMYILPVSATEALVEYTLFSADLLEKRDYELALELYLKDNLKISEYEITHKEFGVIPMYSEPFEKFPANNVVQIGTSGNQTKPSTGYTFTRIQKHSEWICHSLADKDKRVISPQPKPSRFHFYDRIFLHVLAKEKIPGARIFESLFRKNKPKEVFQFLDEDTNFWKEYRLLNTVPIFKFIGPAFKEIWKMWKVF